MKKTTIKIKGVPFIFDDELMDISYQNTRPITVEEARGLLQLTQKLFDKKEIKVYLVYGTLLGAVRDKGLIKGDEDVDVYVENEKGLYDNLPFFYENGLKLCRFVKGRIYSFKSINDSYIDVYIKRPFRFSLWKLWCYSLSGVAVPKKIFRNTTEIEFLGVRCLCVNPPEKLLELLYGKTWRTPIRGHKFMYTIPSYYYWCTLKDNIKRTVKFCIGWNLWKNLVKSGS